ncbi:MAG: TIGR01459 family HAD-type hydrolase [Alphaproteobacteria bacterium]
MVLNNIKSLNGIIHKYNGYIIDLCGVMHNGQELYDTSVAAIELLRANNKKIIFLSNAPRPSTITIQSLKKLGFEIKDEIIITSGDLVREQLSNPTDENFSKFGKKYYFLGYDKNPNLIAGINSSFVRVEDLNSADFLLLAAYITDEEKNKYGFGLYDEILKEAADRNLIAVCANPDKIAPQGSGYNYPAGTFSKRYEEMGGKVCYYGKPHENAYEKAFSIFDKMGIEKSNILAIGDSLETDVLGGNKMNIDSLLLKWGTHRELNEGELTDLVNKLKINPTYLCEGFK